MNKTELVAAIAEKAELSKKDAEKAAKEAKKSGKQPEERRFENNDKARKI